jgi:tetratricopeptide (TPR) repeat protein
VERPRLFLSAVSEELRTARQAVALTVRTIGFDPVSQDDFPTGYGELRQWLREQLDSCEGLIQLVGDGYGAEPPEVDPEFGRTSYTQLEFLYAYKQKKKTWIIVIGKDFARDKSPDQLDLSRDSDHPDPTGYQDERRTLQQDYLARLKGDNHLRHSANNDIELQNVVLRLRDELGLLRQRAERRAQRLTSLGVAALVALAALGGFGWWGYQQLQTGVQQVGVVNTEKIRTHLLQATEETHRRELAEADQEKDWRQRQALRDVADKAQALRVSRIEELTATFAEIEGRSGSTGVFQELARILAEQGVDEAIAYVENQRPTILQTVRNRAATVHELNRAELQPLLRQAALYETKGQAREARVRYAEILNAEPDWPEALHPYFWFLADQGDLARVRTTLADAWRDYEEANRIAMRLTGAEPENTEWQRDLSVSHNKIGDVLRAQGDGPGALASYRKGLAIGETLAKRDSENTQWQRDLSVSHDRIGDVLVAQGDGPGALASYRKGLAIGETLAKRDSANVQWQIDVAVSCAKLGTHGDMNVSERRSYLQRGLKIQQDLHAGNRLAPNQNWIGWFEEQLKKLDGV